jgi:hypothetical protein
MSRGDERIAAVVYPDGALRNIPTWMIEPQAERLDLHEPPRFSQQSLNELRRFIAVALSALEAAATSEPEDAKDGGGA